MKSGGAKRSVRIAQSSMAPLAPLAFLEHGPSVQPKAPFTAKSLAYLTSRGRGRLQVHQGTGALFVTPGTTSRGGQVNDGIVFMFIEMIDIHVTIVGRIIDFYVARCLLFHWKIKEHERFNE